MIRILAARRLALAILSLTVVTSIEATPLEPAASPTALPLFHVRRHQDRLPVVVVVAQKEAVLSDFVVPYGVLAQSGVAKVIALNIADGPLKAGPLMVQPDMTRAEFDHAYPDGADYT